MCCTVYLDGKTILEQLNKLMNLGSTALFPPLGGVIEPTNSVS